MNETPTVTTARTRPTTLPEVLPPFGKKSDSAFVLFWNRERASESTPAQIESSWCFSVSLSRPSRSLSRPPPNLVVKHTRPTTHHSPHQKTGDNSPETTHSCWGTGRLCGWCNTRGGQRRFCALHTTYHFFLSRSPVDSRRCPNGFEGARRVGRPLLIASGFTRAPASILCRPRASRSLPSACSETRAPVSSSARASRGAEGNSGAHTRERQIGQVRKEAKHTEHEKQLDS